ncbi:MAG: J domain-containing protein [Desulfovermiculus sp.]|nr:J domain-containing protein [Desulfovermiculus sp.]
MYLARFLHSGLFRYQIRQSVPDNGVYVSRTLFDLGSDPGSFIVYPGGNSFYLDQDMVETIEKRGRDISYQELENIFWPFVHFSIRRKLQGFHNRAQSRHRPPPLHEAEKEFLRSRIHLVDKRRMNYLRLGSLDQSRLGGVPPQLYRPLLYASRDEIEQHFLRMEMELKANERAMYVYSFLHLRRFFSEICAGTMPQGLDQDKLDEVFEEQLCALNADPDFWTPENPPSSLHPYLVRYAIMFFDHPFGPSPFLDQVLQDFIARHRFHNPPPKKQGMSRDEMSSIFEVPKETLLSMSARQITRRYRRLAKKHHPDQGGDQETFVRLNLAYNWLLSRIKSRSHRK